MPLEADPVDRSNAEESIRIAPVSMPRMDDGRPTVVNRLGDRRNAWLAALNLTAARHFLESSPPRLAGGRVSLLRLAKSIDCDGASNALAASNERHPDRPLPTGQELRDIAARAAKIAADLDLLIDGDRDGSNGSVEMSIELRAVRFSIQALDRAVASMLGEPQQPVPTLHREH
jgi:hypothetical protein